MIEFENCYVDHQGSAQNCLSGGFPSAKLLARMQ